MVVWYGTAVDDRRDGTSFADKLYGRAGNDILRGLAGDDVLFGEAGDDTLDGGLGTDKLDGGSGTDTASYADAGGAVRVSLALTGFQNTGAAGWDQLTSIENLVGGRFNDRLAGNALNNRLDGGDGDDVLDGGAGDDHLLGGTGANTLYGGAGNDRLEAAFGPPGSFTQMHGGPGDDTYVLPFDWPWYDPDEGHGYYFHEKAGEGADWIEFNSNPGGAMTLDDPMFANIENIRINVGSTVFGNAGANEVRGSGGWDTIIGMAGNDRLFGNNGDDEINGDGWNGETDIVGNDDINGGGGYDLLEGGPGADRYWYFRASDAPGDRIAEGVMDFAVVRPEEGDKIAFGVFDANLTLSGTQRFVFAGEGAAPKAGQLTYYHDEFGNRTYLVGNTDGDATVEFAVEIPFPLTITPDLFIYA